MSLKVLICDSDEQFVLRAGKFLSGHGHQVMSEPFLSDVADLADHWKPDVLIISSDTIENDTEGHFDSITAMDKRPAVLLTGQLDRFESAWRAWRKGGDELLLKPIVQAWELHSAIVAALESATGKSAAIQPNSASA
jgi:DNA-binding NtrC family response regulator